MAAAEISPRVSNADLVGLASEVGPCGHAPETHMAAGGCQEGVAHVEAPAGRIDQQELVGIPDYGVHKVPK